MTSEQNLLGEILANPDDLQVRLVYADFLEERGGEWDCSRAELIRLQCELTKRNCTDPDYNVAGEIFQDGFDVQKAKEREEELLRTCRLLLFEITDLLHTTYKNGEQPIQDWKFKNGFIEAITIEPNAFVKHGEDLLKLQPIREVTFRGIPLNEPGYIETLAGLLGSSALKKVRRIGTQGFPDFYLSLWAWLGPQHMVDQGFTTELPVVPHTDWPGNYTLTWKGPGSIEFQPRENHTLGWRIWACGVCGRFPTAPTVREPFPDETLQSYIMPEYRCGRCGAIGTPDPLSTHANPTALVWRRRPIRLYLSVKCVTLRRCG